MTDLNSLFKKVCTNAYHAIKYTLNQETGEVSYSPQLYRRNDLSRWSEETFQRGDTCFYCEPVDPHNPYGKLKRCEPKYEYQLKRPLTEEEYDELANLFETHSDQLKEITEEKNL